MEEKLFMTPPQECRGTDFWMLNDRLDDDELVRQLRSMHEQGIGSVVVRTYIGLKSDYPGKDFKSKMRTVTDEAERLGMTLYMQAGYMPEAVLGLPDKYILGNIRTFDTGENEGRLLCTHGGKEYRLVPSLNILDMLSPEAMEFYIDQSYEKMWSDFRDRFGKTIVSVWVDEPSYGKTDLPYTEGLPDAYRKLWGEDLDLSKIYLMFVDGEGDRLYRYRYWRTVLHLMTESYFRSVRDWCNKNGLMFSGHLMSEDSMENQIHSSCFTMPCYKYFDMPGIDNLETALNWHHGEIKPKADRDRYWRDYGSYNTPIQCSSAAHQAGKGRVLCEMYGVSTENLNFRDQKAIFDHFAALGVNHRSVHGLFYSLRGRGKRAYPPHVNSYQPYWERYHLLTDTVARESYFVRQGEPVRDTVLIHPMDSAFCLYQAVSGADGRNRELRRYDALFNETLRLMVSMQSNFELGDEDSIAVMGDVSDGRMVIGRAKYKTAVLPNCMNIRSTTVGILKRFMDDGGTVIVLGRYPEMVDGLPCDVKSALTGAKFARDHSELGKLLDRCPRSYRYHADDDGCPVGIYYAEDGQYLNFFIHNSDCRISKHGTLSVEGDFTAQRLCPRTGEISPFPSVSEGGRTRVPIDLTEGGSLLLRLERSDEAVSLMPGRAVRSSFDLPHRWKINRRDPNVLLCEMFRFAREGEPMSEKTYPVLAIQEILSRQDYHGNITLEFDIDTDIPLKNALLAVEDPLKQQFFVDGVQIPSEPTGYYRAKAFETIPLPDISAGHHTLTVKRWFEPVKKPKMAVTSLFENLPGVELEQMMILGDFAVRSQIEPTVPHVVRVQSHFTLTDEEKVCGDELVKSGYPFYAGVMDMETSFTLSAEETGKRIFMAVDGLYAGTAEVVCNGQPQGDLTWAPYRVELKNVHEGENTVTLRLYGTLRNLLGPWHRPVGEIGAAWGGYSYPNLPWLGADNNDGTVDNEWYCDRVPDRGGWTESYLMLPVGVNGAKIEMQ